MGTGTGRSAQFGISVPETTYGTYVAPTTFLPLSNEGESFERTQENITIETLQADTFVTPEAHIIPTTRAAAGSVPLPFYRKGMGKPLNLLHGNTVTPTQVATSGAYTQTHNIGLSNPNRSATIQLGRDQVDATTTAWSYVGSKVTEASFACDVNEALTSEWGFDCRDEDTGQSLVTATYPTSNIPFVFTQGIVEIDDAQLTDCVRSFELTVSMDQDTDRHCFGSSGLKRIPLVQGMTIEGTLTVEFASLAHHTAFVNSTSRKLELLFTGAVIGGGESYKANFIIPAMKTQGAAPQASGPDVITYDVPFSAVYNGVDAPLQIVYQSTDTAL